MIGMQEVDTTSSHVLVLRLPSGYFRVSGAIVHPDLTDPVPVGSAENFKNRLKAMAFAKALAGRFGEVPVFEVDHEGRVSVSRRAQTA